MKTAKELREIALPAQAKKVELYLGHITADAEKVAGDGGTGLVTEPIHSAIREIVAKRLMSLGFKVENRAAGLLGYLTVRWDHET